MYDDNSDLKIDPTRSNDDLYQYKVDLYRRYKAAEGEEKLRLKLRIADALVWEVHLCFNQYNDSGVGSGLKELSSFLSGKTDDVSFRKSSPNMREKVSDHM